MKEKKLSNKATLIQAKLLVKRGIMSKNDYKILKRGLESDHTKSESNFIGGAWSGD